MKFSGDDGTSPLVYNTGDVKDLADIFGDFFDCGSGEGRADRAAAHLREISWDFLRVDMLLECTLVGALDDRSKETGILICSVKNS